MKANRKELAILRGKRTPDTLEAWAKAFGEGDRQKAARYALAVATFLGQGDGGEWSDYLGQLSPNTRVAYAYAVAEFFEWIASKYQKVVPPHDVTRKDAEDYIGWLANRPYSLAEEKLKDGDKALLLEIFESVKGAGAPVTLKWIWEALSPDSRDDFEASNRPGFDADATSGLDTTTATYIRRQFHYKVRELVKMDVLSASPTMSELRVKFPTAGISSWEIPISNGAKPLEDVFTYRVLKYKPVARTTVAQRVAALSQFWRILMQGENLRGGEAILQYDVWEAVKRRVNRGIAPEKRQAARQQKMPKEIVLKMLEHAPATDLVSLRDRAILYLLVFTGLRASELLKLRRGVPSNSKVPYFDASEPPAIQVLRKGNKWMRLPYPPVALRPLIEFQAELDRRAAPPSAQFKDPRSSNYQPYSVHYYYRDLQLPDAPLFPSLAFWGANEQQDYRKSMSRVNLFKLLQKMAVTVGVSYEDAKQVHPHAFRHFSATAMAAGGKDLREIQHLLGHTSITTTEGYLEDIDDAVKLSGQAEILDFLEAQGAKVEPTHVGGQKVPLRTEPEVIDTYAEDEGFLDVQDEPLVSEALLLPAPTVEVTRQELAAVNAVGEELPSNELPENPLFDAPTEHIVATPAGDALVSGDVVTLIGVSSDVPDQELLDSVLTHREASDERPTSVGAPDWVYEALASKGDYEPVVFNRGGQAKKDWLLRGYPKIPQDFGVGVSSLLPWFVKVKGNISSAGFSGGVPPFPVLSYWDQVSPTTSGGAAFLREVEKLHEAFVHGDESRGITPSPIRAAGLVRWFGFFSYFASKFHVAFYGHGRQPAVMAADIPAFRPFSSVVEYGDLRMHKTSWLVEWLEKNSHTYRASVDAMKRGVPRGDSARLKKDAEREPAEYFLRASFEGIDLIRNMPEWMIEDDPVNALYRDRPDEYKQFVSWLQNVTGQSLSRDRSVGLDEAQEAQRQRVIRIRDILVSMYDAIDRLSKEKIEEKTSEGRKRAAAAAEGRGAGKGEDAATEKRAGALESLVKDVRYEFRSLLRLYLMEASERSDDVLTALPDTDLHGMNTQTFTKKMDALFDALGVPNPNAKKYRGKAAKGVISSVEGEGPSRVKARIELLIKDLFPESEFVQSISVFAGSALFNPEWFRVDAEGHTVFIEPEASRRLVSEYGLEQSPLLLVRRAARAMWEARDKGYDKMWGVLMCYFSWIVPTGVQMEMEARGIPQTASGSAGAQREARLEWLSTYTKSMMLLAEGRAVASALREEAVPFGTSMALEDIPALETKVAKATKAEEELAAAVLPHAMAGIDVVAQASIRGYSAGQTFSWGGDDEEELDEEETLRQQEEVRIREAAAAGAEAQRKLVERRKAERDRKAQEEREERLRRQAGEEALRKAQQQIREGFKAREERKLTPNRSAGFTKNGATLYLHIEGERPSGFYTVDIFGRNGDLTPNATPTEMVSPGIVYAAQKLIAPATQLLPSPFQMMQAMDLV